MPLGDVGSWSASEHHAGGESPVIQKGAFHQQLAKGLGVNSKCKNVFDTFLPAVQSMTFGVFQKIRMEAFHQQLVKGAGVNSRCKNVFDTRLPVVHRKKLSEFSVVVRLGRVGQ